MSNTNYIIINSKSRIQGNSSNFKYNIGQSLPVDSVCVKSVSIPNTSYNVNPTNNIFKYDLTTVDNTFPPRTVTVPPGQYSTTTLLSTLKGIVDLDVVNVDTNTEISFVVNEITNKISVIGVNAVTGIARFGIYPEGLGKLLGYPVYTNASTGNTTTALELSNLYGVRNYYILSRNLCHGYSSISAGGAMYSLLASIPVKQPWGFMEQWENYDLDLTKRIFLTSQNIQEFGITIADSDGNIIDLHGGEVEIVLVVKSKSIM